MINAPATNPSANAANTACSENAKLPLWFIIISIMLSVYITLTSTTNFQNMNIPNGEIPIFPIIFKSMWRRITFVQALNMIIIKRLYAACPQAVHAAMCYVLTAQAAHLGSASMMRMPATANPSTRMTTFPASRQQSKRRAKISNAMRSAGRAKAPTAHVATRPATPVTYASPPELAHQL